MTYLHSHVGLQNPDISIPVANLTPASDSAHLLKKGIVAFCRDMKAIVADFDSFCTEFAFRGGGKLGDILNFIYSSPKSTSGVIASFLSYHTWKFVKV